MDEVCEKIFLGLDSFQIRFLYFVKVHAYSSDLKTGNKTYQEAVFRHTSLMLSEDLGEDGDITTNALIPPSIKIRAKLVAKQNGVIAGMEELHFFLRKKTKVKLLKPLKDGERIRAGHVLGFLEGNARDILKIERTILNFLQHMCGVATSARAYVEKCGKYQVLVCPTRKTPWGLLDKKACFVGGAGTHRLNLSDAVLVKDTHLDFLGHDFGRLFKGLKSAKKLGRFVEIETESVKEAWKAVELLDELKKYIDVPCAVMLDNMPARKVAAFVRKLRSSAKYNHILVEASGGITLQNLQSYAKTGVDILSVGAMTHSAPALDVSLKIMKARS